MADYLTDRTVQGLKPESRQYEVTDGKVPGLTLRILPSGSKRWSFRYRQHQAWRRLSLGPYPALGLADARQKALDHLRSIHMEGRDPSQERREERLAPTVADLAKRFLTEHVAMKCKKHTYTGYESLLRNHIVPRLGNMKADAVERKHIAQLHHQMQETPTQANRAVAILSKMFNLAEAWGIRPDYSNPCRHIEKYKERSRTRFLSPGELGRLGEALTQAEHEESEPPQAIAALRLLVLTGCRKNEILSLPWDAVNFERSCLHLADSKTGERIVPLGAAALLLLQQMPRNSEWVIPGEADEGHFIGLHRVWARIRKAAGLDDVRIHDLRHSFASVGAAGGESLIILGAILGHRQPSTTHRYAHLSHTPAREAADRISEEIAAAMDGRLAKVLKMPAQRG